MNLRLRYTNVAGDIRGIIIGRNDFPALQYHALPKTVHGGIGYEFRRISDVPSVMHALHLLLQHTPTLSLFGHYEFDNEDFLWRLSEDGLSCEVNWLDPEPSSESRDYETYVRKLRGIERCLNA